MICSVEGCPKPSKTRGWCSAHYERWRLNGDPGSAGDGRKRPKVPCSVDGCETLTSGTSGMCYTHRQRVTRTGSPHLLVRPTYGTKRRVRSDGYIDIYEPDHPLALCHGYVAEHRKVLFDAGVDMEGKHVHHINGDKTDNRIENLEAVTPSDHQKKYHSAEYINNGRGVFPVLKHDPEAWKERFRRNARIYAENRRQRLLADPSIRPHGNYSTYKNWGCRCRPCKDAFNERQRKWVANRKGLTV